MEKARLYEALYLVNRSIEEVVRGVQRLKEFPQLFMQGPSRAIGTPDRFMWCLLLSTN